MAKRHKEVAKKMRAWLIEHLGGKCAWENKGCRGKLTFDCKEPQGDAHHKGSTDQRMAFYWKQWKLGNLQLLCERHNAVKGRKERGHHNFDPSKMGNPGIASHHQPNANEPF